MTGVAEKTDRWHRWLLDRRFGGDAAFRERELTGFLYPIRDTVLDKARLRKDDTLLDVGSGDGMIAFGALERLGPAGRVIFSDISAGPARPLPRGRDPGRPGRPLRIRARLRRRA
jgi:hypothetical protein